MQAGACDHIWSPTRTDEGWSAFVWRRLRTWSYGIFSDGALVQRARAGDDTAFDALVARYRDRLYALALGSLGDEGAAGDALSEIVLSAFKDIDSFRAGCAPGTWLYLHGFRSLFKR
jgi:hypothetical protein